MFRLRAVLPALKPADPAGLCVKLCSEHPPGLGDLGDNPLRTAVTVVLAEPARWHVLFTRHTSLVPFEWVAQS